MPLTQPSHIIADGATKLILNQFILVIIPEVKIQQEVQVIHPLGIQTHDVIVIPNNVGVEVVHQRIPQERM